MPRTPEQRIVICAFAAALLLLDGCGFGAGAILEHRNKRFTELKQIYVVSLPQPPPESELAARLGRPTIYRVEDLSLDAYQLDYEELKLLHAEMRSATGRDDNSGDICEGTAECVALALLSPLLVYDAPVSAIVLAFEEGERVKQVEQLSGRLAVFAYDANGNYRWQGCCFPPDFIDENGPRITRLPDPANSANWKENPPDAYWADYQVLFCHRAKAGDSYFQGWLFRRFNETVFDPVHTYYWARIEGENSHRGNSRYLQGVESSLPPEALRAGERYFRSHPLDTVDCREVADMLVEAKNSGSEGPNFKIARPSLGSAEPTKAAMSGIFDCPLAKAGDISAQWSIFRMVNAMVPDPIETYYWARVVKDNPKGWSYTYERIQRTLPIVTVEAGEKYYLTHPLELIDCASLWSTLAKAQEAGSEGPKLGGNRSAYSVP